MSLIALLGAAAAMGLLGGLHCVAMCSALQQTVLHGSAPVFWAPDLSRRTSGLTAQPADGQTITPRTHASSQWTFHLARITGYALLGAAAGSGSAVLRWGAEALPLMRPVWAMLNAALLALGLALAVGGRQPAWLDALGQRVWQSSGASRRWPREVAPALAGLVWAALPCGLLYSALALALLASDPLRGAAALFVFGLGTVLHLSLARAALQALMRRSPLGAQRLQAHGTRASGILLALMALAALVALALGQAHPFCAS